MIRLAAAILGLGAAFAAMPVTAAEGEEAAPACSATDSAAMTIGEITALGDAAIGRCVTVEGWVIGDTLHADNIARYRAERIYNDPSSTGAIIGFYGRDYGPPVAVRAAGRMGDCDALEAHVKTLGPGKVVGGFCSYRKGLYLEANNIRETGTVDRVRLTAQSAPGLGNLAPMAAGFARERLADAFEPLLAALRSSDRDALQKLLRLKPAIGSHIAYVGGVPRWDKHVVLLTENGRIPPLDDAQIEIFGWRAPLWADAETTYGNRADMERTTQGIVCAAPAAHANAGVWPISEADAAAAPGRPYICARISIDAAGGIEYSIAHDGLPAREPA